MSQSAEGDAPTCEPCDTGDHDACDGYARTWDRGYVTFHACPCAASGHKGAPGAPR